MLLHIIWMIIGQIHRSSRGINCFGLEDGLEVIIVVSSLCCIVLLLYVIVIFLRDFRCIVSLGYEILLTSTWSNHQIESLVPRTTCLTWLHLIPDFKTLPAGSILCLTVTYASFNHGRHWKGGHCANLIWWVLWVDPPSLLQLHTRRTPAPVCKHWHHGWRAQRSEHQSHPSHLFWCHSILTGPSPLHNWSSSECCPIFHQHYLPCPSAAGWHC